MTDRGFNDRLDELLAALRRAALPATAIRNLPARVPPHLRPPPRPSWLRSAVRWFLRATDPVLGAAWLLERGPELPEARLRPSRLALAAPELSPSSSGPVARERAARPPVTLLVRSGTEYSEPNERSTPRPVATAIPGPGIRRRG